MSNDDRKRSMSAADLLQNECIIRELSPAGSPWEQLSRVLDWERDAQAYALGQRYGHRIFLRDNAGAVLTMAANELESIKPALAATLRELRDGPQ